MAAGALVNSKSVAVVSSTMVIWVMQAAESSRLAVSRSAIVVSASVRPGVMRAGEFVAGPEQHPHLARLVWGLESTAEVLEVFLGVLGVGLHRVVPLV